VRCAPAERGRAAPQAGVAGAMQRALLTVLALWLPLLPFFFVMRHLIRERSGMRAPPPPPPPPRRPAAQAAARRAYLYPTPGQGVPYPYPWIGR